MAVTDESVERAVDFIKSNAKRHGQLRTAALLAEYKVKRAKALEFLAAKGTVAEREAQAQASDAVHDAALEHSNLAGEETELRDYFQAANLTFEKWRTEQANNRKGLV